MIEILEAAEFKQLVSLTRLKAQLGITDPAEDELLTYLLDAASSFIVDYTGREFARERIKETVPGYGTTNLLLSRGYVDTVNSVTHEAEILTDYIIENPEAGILYRSRGWVWTAGTGFQLTMRPIAGTEEPKFVIDYYGGYWLSSFTGMKPDGIQALPASLEQACIELIRLWYTENKSNMVSGVESLRIGDYSVKFGASNGVPKPILMILNRWQRAC